MPVLRSEHPAWLSNAWLAWDRDAGTAVAVDSGAPLDPLLEALRRHGLTLAAVLTTHRHPDHVAGHDALVRHARVRVLAPALEAPHVPFAEAAPAGEEIALGGLRARLVPLPGHTAGHGGWLVEGVGLFTGDALFRGSLGGTVGPAAASWTEARASLETLASLPEDLALLPGHGPPTTVGEERRSSVLLRAILGLDPPATRPARVLGRPATLFALSRDYDGGTKGWVRFEDGGGEALVPGSRIEILG